MKRMTWLPDISALKACLLQLEAGDCKRAYRNKVRLRGLASTRFQAPATAGFAAVAAVLTAQHRDVSGSQRIRFIRYHPLPVELHF